MVASIAAGASVAAESGPPVPGFPPLEEDPFPPSVDAGAAPDPELEDAAPDEPVPAPGPAPDPELDDAAPEPASDEPLEPVDDVAGAPPSPTSAPVPLFPQAKPAAIAADNPDATQPTRARRRPLKRYSFAICDK
ncbi:MAG: hypothetical protein M3O46_07170 [Myxococcota bacterium]|nr:hypothetical protein [Myxococcota bacterium]